jgi:hypothetical protein
MSHEPMPRQLPLRWDAMMPALPRGREAVVELLAQLLVAATTESPRSNGHEVERDEDA